MTAVVVEVAKAVIREVVAVEEVMVDRVVMMMPVPINLSADVVDIKVAEAAEADMVGVEDTEAVMIRG